MSEMGSIIEYGDSLADATPPKALPDNDYPGEVTATELETSKNSGRLQVKVTFRIAPEDYPADYEDANSYPDGKSVTTYVPAEDDKASRWRMHQFCEAIGVKLGKKLDVNEWIGHRAMLSITAEEFNEQERERVGKITAL